MAHSPKSRDVREPVPPPSIEVVQRLALSRGFRIRVEGPDNSEDETVFTLIAPDGKPATAMLRGVSLGVIVAGIEALSAHWSAPAPGVAHSFIAAAVRQRNGSGKAMARKRKHHRSLSPVRSPSGRLSRVGEHQEFAPTLVKRLRDAGASQHAG